MTCAVLFFAHSYPAGLVYHLAHLACELMKIPQEEQFKIFICSEGREQYTGTWDLLKSQVPVEHIVCFKDYDHDITMQLEGFLKRFNKVLVHFGGGIHQLRPLMGIRKKYAGRVKLVATTHAFHCGTWKQIPASLVQSILYRRYVDHVIFQTPYTARKWVGAGWFFSRGKASIIPLGVEVFNEMETQKTPEDALGKPDIRDLLRDKTFFNVVYLASFKSGKEHVWLLNALASVLRENPKIRLFFLGDGLLFDDVQQRIQALHLNEQVICPGRVQRKWIPWVLAQPQVALVASRGETFGHCFLEPAFASLPILGTRVGVGEYLIQDMQTGIAFNHDDVKGFQSALRFLATHPEAAKNMGNNLKVMVQTHFSHASIAHAHHNLYRALLGS